MIDDATLVRQARGGDHDAFASLYDAYFARIYDFAYQMVRSHEDAADVASDTFLRAMERLRSLKDVGAFRGWLYTIARNVALTLLERRGRSTLLPDDAEVVTDTDPADLVATEDLRRLVWDAAAMLNPRDYSIFEMTVRQGLDSSEVADALGVKRSHAYVLVSRLKDTIEDALSAVVLIRAGRRECATLDALVATLGDAPTPDLRRAVGAHLKACDDCRRSRAKYATAAALLGGVAAAAPMAGVKDRIAEQIAEAWAGRGPRPRNGSRRRRLAATAAVPLLMLLFTVVAAGQRVTPSALGLAELRTPLPVRPEIVLDAGPTPGVEPEATASTEPAQTPTPTPRPSVRPTPLRTAPPTGPRVDSVSISPQVLYAGPCGPRTATLTARVSAPAGVSSVRFTARIGGLTRSEPMQGSGTTWRATLGPYDAPGTLQVTVFLTDAKGQTSQSSTSAIVAGCQGATPPPFFPTPPPGREFFR